MLRLLLLAVLLPILFLSSQVNEDKTKIKKKDGKTSEYEALGIGSTFADLLIGGEDDSSQSKFIPEVRFSFKAKTASEKLYFKLKRMDVEVDKEKEKTKGESISLKIGNEEDVFLTSKKSLKWDINLTSNTLKYKWDYKIKCSPEIKFFYQPDTLPNIESIHNGYRPDSVKGSYAVYGNISGNNKDTGESWYSGKLFHIYRPKFIDADGNEQWGVLNITGKSGNYDMSISVDEKWLDKATFPVTIDPDFGYTTAGGSFSARSDRATANIRVPTPNTTYTAGASEEITAYYVYGKTVDDVYISAYTYNPTADHPVNRLHTQETITLTASEAWQSVTGLSHAMTQDTIYCVAVTCGTCQIAWDNADGEGNSQDDSNTSLPLVWDENTQQALILSMYATYSTASASNAQLIIFD